ncbi:MAG: glycosyltransferase family 4 protein [Flavobacteriaceae bacterium]|nr:glycosyltransferase family 4 protein [Flavobacteriaceae bacterium]
MTAKPLAKNKLSRLLIITGSNHTIPPIDRSPGVARIIYNLTIKVAPQFQVKTISRYSKELENLSFDKGKFIHIKEGQMFLLFVKLLNLIPYKVKKYIFGISHSSRIIYFLSILLKAYLYRPKVIVTFMHFELFHLVSFLLPSSKHVFFYRSSGILERLGKKKLDYLVRKCDGILANTKDPITTIKVLYPNLTIPLDTIYNSVDFKLFDKHLKVKESISNINLDKSNLTIGYAGRLVSEKSLYDLLKVIHSFKKEGKLINLILAGDPSYEKNPEWDYYDKLKNFASTYLPSQVHFIGWVPNSELKKLYTQIDIGLLLSKFREGNSMFLLECMAMGKPVICSDIGGNVEVVKDKINGFLVSGENLIPDLKNILCEIIKNKQLLSATGDNAYNYVKTTHNYEIQSQQFNDFILTLLNK